MVIETWNASPFNKCSCFLVTISTLEKDRHLKTTFRSSAVDKLGGNADRVVHLRLDQFPEFCDDDFKIGILWNPFIHQDWIPPPGRHFSVLQNQKNTLSLTLPFRVPQLRCIFSLSSLYLLLSFTFKISLNFPLSKAVFESIFLVCRQKMYCSLWKMRHIWCWLCLDKIICSIIKSPLRNTALKDQV